MIVRAWTARALSQNVEAYARHFREAVLPELQEISSHTGAYLLRRDAVTHAELVCGSTRSASYIASGPVERHLLGRIEDRDGGRRVLPA